MAHNECPQGFVGTINATWRGHGGAEPEEQGQTRACQELSLQKPGRKIASKPAELGSLWQCRENGACGVGGITRHNLSQLGRLGAHWPCTRSSSHPSPFSFSFPPPPYFPPTFCPPECEAHPPTRPVSSFNWLKRSILHAHSAGGETEAWRNGGMGAGSRAGLRNLRVDYREAKCQSGLRSSPIGSQLLRVCAGFQGP